MKTEFISTVSHELRTPLTSTLGFTKLIQKRFRGVVQPKFEPETKKEERALKKNDENLEVILSEGARLTRVLHQFRFGSRTTIADSKLLSSEPRRSTHAPWTICAKLAVFPFDEIGLKPPL